MIRSGALAHAPRQGLQQDQANSFVRKKPVAQPDDHRGVHTNSTFRQCVEQEMQGS